MFFSGGMMSWAAAKRAVERYGAENVTLAFTDTLIEDADLYRFIVQAAANVLGVVLPFVVPSAEDFPEQFEDGTTHLTPEWRAFHADLRRRAVEAMPGLAWLADGRTPWEVFNDRKMIGNTRADPCSDVLKRKLGLKWLTENCDPANTALVFGIHIEEEHRLEGIVNDPRTGEPVSRGVRPRYRDLGWPHVEAPMCDSPWMSPRQISHWLEDEGLRRPRLYVWGFAHNNCGGFCVKGGEGSFANLLLTLPGRYRSHEGEEEAFNERRPGRNRQTVLAPERVVAGKRRRVPMSLREFREHIEAGNQVNMFEVGGCGCFLDDPADLAAELAA